MPTVSISPQIVLLVFYLYLLVRWERVNRPMCFLVGTAGLLLILACAFFGLGSGKVVTALGGVFSTIGLLVAFVGAVGACFGGELPVKLPGDLDKSDTAGPQA